MWPNVNNNNFTEASPSRDGLTAPPKILVSTFGSARGLDLAAVDCVVLYSLPSSADLYLHVSGRTGRQGRSGHVLALLTADEQPKLGVITRQLGISFKPMASEGV